MTDPPAPTPQMTAGPERPDDSTAPAQTGHLSPRAAARWRMTLLVVAVVSPIIVALVTAARSSWWPTSDLALEYLRSLDVGTGHTPLVGAYSRYHFNHPGPLMFYVFAPFVRLFGPAGMFVATGLVNAASIAGAVLIANRRRGIWAAVVVALGCTVLVRTISPAFAVNPWNPWTPMFPFLFAALCSWAICEGDARLLPWLIVAASYAVQTHIGYVILVAVLLAAPVASLAIRHRRSARGILGRFKASIIIAVIAGVVLWAPTLIQQIRGDPGNYVAIWRSVFESSRPPVGGDLWLHVMAGQLSPTGPWLTGGEQISGDALASMSAPITWAIVVPIAAIVLGALASRRHDRAPLRFAVYVVVLNIAGYVSLTRIDDLPAAYLFRWIYVLAALMWGSIIVSLVVLALDAVPSLRRYAANARWPAVAAVSIFALALIPSATDMVMPAASAGHQTRHLADLVAPHLDRGTRYQVDWFDRRVMEGRQSGFIAALADKGYRALLPWSRVAAFQLGTNRVVNGPGDADAILTVRSFDRAGDATAEVPKGARVILSYDPLSTAAHRRVARLTRERSQVERKLKSVPRHFTLEGKRLLDRLSAIDGELKGVPDSYVVTVRPAAGSGR